jgi:hypothetical protein
MGKHHRTIVIDESPRHLRCKTIRSLRLYGAPTIFFPKATLIIDVDHEENASALHYAFKRPEYYVVTISATLLGVLSSSLRPEAPAMNRIAVGFVSFLFLFLFFGLCVFLDTKLVSRRIRKILTSLSECSESYISL